MSTQGQGFLSTPATNMREAPKGGSPHRAGAAAHIVIIDLTQGDDDYVPPTPAQPEPSLAELFTWSNEEIPLMPPLAWSPNTVLPSLPAPPRVQRLRVDWDEIANATTPNGRAARTRLDFTFLDHVIETPRPYRTTARAATIGQAQDMAQTALMAQDRLFRNEFESITTRNVLRRRHTLREPLTPGSDHCSEYHDAVNPVEAHRCCPRCSYLFNVHCPHCPNEGRPYNIN